MRKPLSRPLEDERPRLEVGFIANKNLFFRETRKLNSYVVKSGLFEQPLIEAVHDRLKEADTITTMKRGATRLTATITRIGTGNAFAKVYANNNAIIDVDGYRLLIDCGITAPSALHKLVDERGVRHIFHDCQLTAPGTVHACLDELLTLPVHNQAMIRLMHYGDTMPQYIGRTGAMSFVEQGKSYMI
jgi:hypothetical protein